MKKTFTLPKKTTLVNLGNSILKHFNVEPFHDTFIPLDKILKKTDKKKICLILFDACGKHIIEKHKNLMPFIYSHQHIELNSTFPATTVCATTALTTAKYPIETGYLGWNQYYQEFNDFLDVFSSRSKLTKNIYNDAKKRHPIEYIWEIINKTNNKNIASYIQSFQIYNEKLSTKENLINYFNETDKLLKKFDFIYSYCTEPDHHMHEFGTDDQKVKDVLVILNDELEKLVNKNKDVLFLLIADHGMVDIDQWFYNDNQEFLNTLEKPYCTIEPRFCSFFVKDENKFIEYYNKNLKEYFILKTSKELIKEHTFGYGTPLKDVETFFGNYFLLGTKNLSINDGLGPLPGEFNGNHAGVTPQETELYLTVFNK